MLDASTRLLQAAASSCCRCSLDRFPCRYQEGFGLLEMSAAWLCDGQIDCSGGEDESVDVCGAHYENYQCNQCQFDCGAAGSLLGAMCIHADMRCNGVVRLLSSNQTTALPTHGVSYAHGCGFF
jgi:hypothetical protein